MKMRLHIVLIAVLIFSSVGCGLSSSSRKPLIEPSRNREFRVSVKSDGRELRDFTTPLVHRISISQDEIRRATYLGVGTVQLPFKSLTEFDLNGKIKGFTVVGLAQSGVRTDLGLRDGDVVTAVGRCHVGKVNDLRQLFDDLQKNGEATLTFERDGKPHKVFYSRRD